MDEQEQGYITPWHSEKSQKSTYASAPILEVSLDQLLNNPQAPESVEHHTDGVLTQRGTGSTISNNDYYFISLRNYSHEEVYDWAKELGIIPYVVSDRDVITGIPFNNLFYGVKLNSLHTCQLFNPVDWGNDSANYEYTMGSSTGVGDGLTCFSLLRSGSYIGWIMYSYLMNNGDIIHTDGVCVMCDTSKWTNLLGSFTIEEEPKDDPQKGIPSIPIGAAGDVVTKALEEIQIPDKPVLGVSSLGTYNVYKVGLMDLTNFMSEIFHTTTRTNYSGNDFGELMATALINIDKGMNDLVKGDVTQFVVDTHIIPCTPETSAYTNIGIGGYLTNSRGMPVTSDYIDVDCGAIRLGKGYTTHYDSFQDMSTRLKLYLPFIGYVDLDNNLIWKVKNQPQSIRVRYRFNVLDGSCMAFVSSGALGDGSTTSIIGVYSGSCCVHMPLTGANYSSVISGMIQTASGIATGLATGNPLTATMGVGNGLANLMKPNTTMSNSYNATSSFMGIRRPYLIIQKNTQNMPINFYERNGGLCMISYKLNDIKGSGFTKCANVDTNTFGNLKKHEKEELKRMLESGVYL